MDTYATAMIAVEGERDVNIGPTLKSRPEHPRTDQCPLPGRAGIGSVGGGRLLAGGAVTA